MREGQPNGQEDQGDTEKKKAQSDERSAPDTPVADIKPVEPEAEFNASGGSNSEHGPEISHCHRGEGEAEHEDGSKKLPSWLTPEWVSAGSTLAAVIVAVAALAVSVFGYLTSKDQVEIAKRAFSEQQRPWVKISEARIATNAMTGDVERGTALLSVRFKITNTGVIPATNVTSLTYDYYPMSASFDLMPRDGEPSVAAKSCIKHREPGSDSSQSFGGTLFPNDSRDADSDFSSGFPDNAEIDLGITEGAFFPGGIIIVHVTYQSSVDITIRCTAEAYYFRVKSSKKPIITPKVQMKGKWVGEINRRNFSLDAAGIGGSYAD